MDTQFTEALSLLDKYLSPTFRENIEKTIYEKINANARLNEVIKDPLFLAHPLKHISLQPDHGLIHVRDIAYRLLELLEQLNGIHFAKRNPTRLAFMKGFGVMLAYVHDIGILTVKTLDHDMHAHAAAQMIYNEYFDQQLSLLWDENSGNVAWQITKLAFKKALSQPPKHILREMLTLCGAHAKEIISVETLNNPFELRHSLQEMIAYPLEYQWLELQYKQAENQLKAAEHLDVSHKEKYIFQKQKAEEILNSASAQKELNGFLKLYYHDFWNESFQWLVSENIEALELVSDVLDTLRILRVANASRQRGAKLRTNGEQQIFLDHHSANAIYAINADQKLYLLETKNTLLAGEVNLSSTEFTQNGDLRIAFYTGHFADEETIQRAIFNAAVAVNEVQEDMIGSFSRPPTGRKPVFILLENCDDNPDFSNQVKTQLILLNPKLKEMVRVAPSLQNASEQERNRYLNAEELQWNVKTENEILEKIATSGHKISNIHVQNAFTDIKCADISAGEILFQAGTLASFVYVPFNDGLIGYPLGGYAPFHAKAFIPLGNVGVIRADTRNATLIAEHPVKILIIPREIYLKYWHNTYNEQEFMMLLKDTPSIIQR